MDECDLLNPPFVTEASKVEVELAPALPPLRTIVREPNSLEAVLFKLGARRRASSPDDGVDDPLLIRGEPDFRSSEGLRRQVNL